MTDRQSKCTDLLPQIRKSTLVNPDKKDSGTWSSSRSPTMALVSWGRSVLQNSFEKLILQKKLIHNLMVKFVSVGFSTTEGNIFC